MLHASYGDAVKSLAEDMVESLTARLEDAQEEISVDGKIDLYNDVCSGGPLRDYYVCAVHVWRDGRIVDDEGNVYWPQR